MKYRELSPQEIEAYNIGYKVGNRQIIITDIEWESENEHKIYRKGYMAGLMDYKRKVNNINNVSNVEIRTSTTPIGISISKGNMVKETENSNKGGVGEKEKNENIRGAFVVPSEKEVLEYAKQMDGIAGIGGFKCSRYTAEQFWSHYQSCGWIGGNGVHLTDWKAKLKEWCIKNKMIEKEKMRM